MITAVLLATALEFSGVLGQSASEGCPPVDFLGALCVAEDPAGRVWFHGGGRTLCRIEKEGDFTPFAVSPIAFNTLFPDGARLWANAGRELVAITVDAGGTPRAGDRVKLDLPFAKGAVRPESDGGRPKLMRVSEILKKNAERLTALTKRELEIRLKELDDLFHARTLDRIFIEERIYKRIEKEKTMEGIQSTVKDGFKPFRKELRRDVTNDDVERLLKLQIRRISQFDIDKNREEIKAIKAEEKEVGDNLVHLRAFVVKYLKGLVKEYAKKYPRMTTIAKSAFKEVDVKAITASELTIKWDRENGFVGSGLRGGDELFKCSSLDELIFIWKDGRFKKMQPDEKIFVDKDLMTVLRYDQEKERDTRSFTLVYEEGSYGFSYIKRFTFGGLIRNKEYHLAPAKGKTKILFLQEGCPETLYVRYKPAKGQKIHQQHFLPLEKVDRVNLETGRPEKREVVEIRGAGTKGKQLSTKPIARVASAKGAWWDESEPPSKGVLD